MFVIKSGRKKKQHGKLLVQYVFRFESHQIEETTRMETRRRRRILGAKGRGLFGEKVEEEKGKLGRIGAGAFH